MKLSIVDQSPVSTGSSPAEALANSIDLARLAEALGYTRYWIAEHHGMQGLASTAPEILIARIAAETREIRVGSGGIMLPHYAPLKVAETFRMLETLYPGRIDLGLGRAPGGTPLESAALRHGAAGEQEFTQQMLHLFAFLDGGFPPDHPFGRIHVAPEPPHGAGAADHGPVPWLLGSSLWSAHVAAQLGLPYAFAHFIAPEQTREAVAYYLDRFEPSRRQPRPRAMLAAGVVCADTKTEAERLYLTNRLMYRRLRQGNLGTIPSPEEAAAELGPHPEPDPAYGDGNWPRYVVGDPLQARDRLGAMAEVLGVDEILAVTITHDHQARRRSYELLARAFGLSPRAP